MTAAVVDLVEPMVLGMFISSLLFGVVLMQMIVYVQQCSDDRPALKIVVAMLCALETAQFVLYILVIKFYLITNYDNPEALGTIPKVVAVAYTLSFATGAIVNWCFTWRIYILSQSSCLAGFLAFCATCSAALSMRNCLLGLTHDTWATYHEHVYPAVITASAMSLFVDAAIAVTMSYLLHSRRTGWATTDSLIRQLLFYTLNTGVAVFILSFAVMISFLTIDGDTFVAFVQIESEVFCISLMTTLIGRKKMKPTNQMLIGFNSAGPTTYRMGSSDSQPLQTSHQMHSIIAIAEDQGALATVGSGYECKSMEPLVRCSITKLPSALVV